MQAPSSRDMSTRPKIQVNQLPPAPSLSAIVPPATICMKNLSLDNGQSASHVEIWADNSQDGLVFLWTVQQYFIPPLQHTYKLYLWATFQLPWLFRRGGSTLSGSQATSHREDLGLQKAGNTDGAHFHPRISMGLIDQTGHSGLSAIILPSKHRLLWCNFRGLIVPDPSPLDFISSTIKWKWDLLHRVIIMMKWNMHGKYLISQYSLIDHSYLILSIDFT